MADIATSNGVISPVALLLGVGAQLCEPPFEVAMLASNISSDGVEKLDDSARFSRPSESHKLSSLDVSPDFILRFL